MGERVRAWWERVFGVGGRVTEGWHLKALDSGVV